MEEKGERFRLSHLSTLIKKTAFSWNKDDPWRLSAIVACYAILSLPSLLVIIINSLSYLGTDTLKEKYSAAGSIIPKVTRGKFRQKRMKKRWKYSMMIEHKKYDVCVQGLFNSKGMS